MFVDEDSVFDLDVADSSSNSREQVCKTSQQDSVEMAVFRLFDAENTVVTPHLFIFSPLTDCYKVWNEL